MITWACVLMLLQWASLAGSLKPTTASIQLLLVAQQYSSRLSVYIMSALGLLNVAASFCHAGL